MKVDRRSALKGLATGWPAAFAAAAAQPAARAHLSSFGRALAMRIVMLRTQARWGWVHLPAMSRGRTEAQADRLQVAMGRWEIAQLKTISAKLLRMGL